MIRSHLEKLQKELERTHWVVNSDTSTMKFLDRWEISRPNGDCRITIEFTMWGNGEYGGCIGNENKYNASGCTVEGYPEADLYFGKFSGRFQTDLPVFISLLNKIGDKK